MEKYLEFLSGTILFSDIPQESINDILKATGARIAEYEKNEAIIREGSFVSDLGIVLSGRGRSVKIDKSGKELIITLLGKGDFIGVLLAASAKRRSPVTIEALERLTALLMPFEGILKGEYPHRNILLLNCFDSVSEKSMMLYDRIECLIRPSVREKITSYLSRISTEKGSRVFDVPMDRSAMAAYLNVDRSALSRELSNMKRDGLIDYYKSSFKFLGNHL